MSSDDTIPRGDVRFRPAGVGLAYSMRCGKCSGPMPNLGRKLLRVRGAKVWVCPGCQPKPAGGAA